MRRLGWFIAGFGVAAAAAARFFRRSSPPPSPLEQATEPADPRADDLRRRIAESRELVDERDEFEAAETPVDEADPSSRRRAVHERGRAAAEQMRRDST